MVQQPEFGFGNPPPGLISSLGSGRLANCYLLITQATHSYMLYINVIIACIGANHSATSHPQFGFVQGTPGVNVTYM